MPVILKENRIQNYGPDCIFAASLQDLAGIEAEGWDIIGAPVIVETPWGKGTQFDGTSDYIRCESNPPAGSVTTQFSMCILASLTSIAQSGQIVLYGDGNGVDNFYIDFVAPNTFRFVTYSAVSHVVQHVTSPAVGEWFLLTATVDTAGDQILYINDIPEASANVTWVYSILNPRTTIGSRYDGLYKIPAVVDSVLMFNKSLSQADITSLYNNIIGLGTNP